MEATDVPPGPMLEYLPVSLFGSVMGLTGLSVAWHLAQARYGVPATIAIVIGAIAMAAFVVIATGYAIKILTAPGAVKDEFEHPIARNLFGTAIISALLLPIVLAPLSLPLARGLWAAGTVAMIAFAWFIVDRWLSDRQQVAHATPAWVVPVVGMLDIPLAVPALHLPPLHGLMVVALAVGLFFAVPLFTLIFARLVFEAPMPEALQPTLMILVAPFAVGTSAYIATTGQVDLFAQALYGLTLFMLGVLIGRLRYLGRCCPFRLSWWAVSFPLAAAAIASLRIATAFPDWTTDAVSLVLLVLATSVIGWLFGRTLMGVVKGELRKLSA